MSASPSVSVPDRLRELPPPRPFGRHRADLDLDFGQTDRAALVTSLLALCCEEAAAPSPARTDAAWQLPVGVRIARLGRIVALSTESETLPVMLRCPHDDCRQPFETSLPLAELTDAAPGEATEPDIIPFPLDGEQRLALRRPTGRDQSAWQVETYPSAEAATEAIIRSLLLPPHAATPLAPEQLTRLAATMEEADPLVALRAATTCPECGRAVDLPVDLELTALQTLAALRRSLLREIHTLATRYGWSEEAILAIPTARRAEYRRLIADEEEDSLS